GGGAHQIRHPARSPVGDRHLHRPLRVGASAATELTLSYSNAIRSRNHSLPNIWTVSPNRPRRPAVQRPRHREHPRIEHRPDDDQRNRNQRPPADPGSDPDRHDQEHQNRDAGVDAPRIGVPPPGVVTPQSEILAMPASTINVVLPSLNADPL